MIGKLSGVLADKSPGEVIVETGGVGYQIFIPLTVFYRMPEVGERVTLHVYTHLREDALQLFGFSDAQEKRLFTLLTAVSGIGPKLALNIMSGIPADELARALKEEDEARLVAIPGVGKKLAERMLLELRDRLAPLALAEDGRGQSSQLVGDALSALVNLGYRSGEAEKVVREIVQAGTAGLEEILKEALRRLSR